MQYRLMIIPDCAELLSESLRDEAIKLITDHVYMIFYNEYSKRHKQI